MELNDKVVIVTGAGSSGEGWSIGRATSVTLAKLGATIIASDVHLQSAQDTVAAITAAGGKGIAVQADVTDETAMRRLARVAMTEFGQIDVYVANVGVGKVSGVMQTTPSTLLEVFSINVASTMLGCQLIIPEMLKKSKGSIITLSSIAGLRFVNFPHLSYSVTKAAVIHMTRMIAQEYADQGIRANTVVPGLVNTPRIMKSVLSSYSGQGNFEEMKEKRNKQVPMGRMGTPWEIANAIAFLASDHSSYITGTEIVVDGGITGRI